MADTSLNEEQATPEGMPRQRVIFLGIAAVLLIVGLVGQSHAAVGYALFLLATMLILSGVGLLAIFALTRLFDGHALRRAFATAFWMGAWTYVFSVSALAGYYVFEALSGRVETKFILFGPTILAAIIILDVGIYKIIVRRNLPTIRRFGDLWSRDALDQPALRKNLVDEVILHRSLLATHPLRWARHQLIFWGFGLMFMTEIVAVAFREAFPAFGWIDLWHQPSHPLKLAFDLAYEITGLMILVGCLLALGYRMVVNGTEQQKYTDTPTTVFLLFVVVTGFMTEGSRLAINPDTPEVWASFVGLAFVPVSPGTAMGYETLWLVHMFASCAFIAYVPMKRMIHSCATPIGRLVNSQVGLMAAKKRRVIEGLARWKGPF